jgi:hypothetical protein
MPMEFSGYTFTYETTNGNDPWPYNQEKQGYDDQHASINSEGHLEIKLEKVPVEGSDPLYKSSRLIMMDDKEELKLEKHKQISIEFEGKMPKSMNDDGTMESSDESNPVPLWPAFWMMGTGYKNNSTDQPWPFCSEIDVLEWAPTLGNNRYSNSIHYDNNGHQYLTSIKTGLSDLRESFHRYKTVLKRDNDDNVTISMYFDDVLVHTYNIDKTIQNELFQRVDKNNSVIDSSDEKHFGLLMNLALGGNYTGKQGEVIHDSYPNFKEATLVIKSVKVEKTDLRTLFFSEYAEGLSNNKYLEIFNPTDEAIDLSDYHALPSVGNAVPTPGQHEFWNVIFEEGDVIQPKSGFIVYHPDASQYIKDKAAEIGGREHLYLSNGDDGYKLVKGTQSSYVVLDCIGDFQGDPGDGWDVAGVSQATKDHTLVRKSSVVTGNTNWNASRGTNAEDSEWIVKPNEEWTYLGQHTMITPAEPETEPEPGTGDQVPKFNTDNYTFDGTTVVGDVYTFPSGAQPWAGFSNSNTDLYPLTFSNAGKITFDYSTESDVTIRFRLEWLPYPNVNPSYDTAEFTCTTGSGSGEISIPSQGDKTFSSLLLYIVDRDIPVTLTNFKIYSDAAPEPEPEQSSGLQVTVQVPEGTTSVRLTGPWWGWDPNGGPVASDNGDNTWTVTFDPAPTEEMQYLWVVDDVQENLVDNAQNGELAAMINAGIINTDYSSYANRVWILNSGNVTNNVFDAANSEPEPEPEPEPELEFVGEPKTTATEDVLYTYTPQISYDDKKVLTMTAVTLPTWLTPFYGTTLRGTPTKAVLDAYGTSHPVKLVVTADGNDPVEQEFTITIDTSNTPPQFDSDAPTTATEDVLYTYTPQVSDPDGDSLTITADTLPGWLTFDGTTLSGTPTQAVLDADGTSHLVKLVVSDGSDSVEQEFTITIIPVNDAPFFTSNPVTTASEDVLYTYTPVVNDVDSTSLTIADPVLPAWLTFENGVLSGTPSLNDDKVTNIELTVSDGELSTKQLFTITLNYNVKTIAQAEYNKKPASGLGDSGKGFDFSVKHLIITTSTSTYNPTEYGAKTIIETNQVLPYEDGKVLVRDSRLDNANESQMQQIAAEWAIKNNHYNFHYDTSNKIIFINESVGSNYILKDNTMYKTGYLNKKRVEVFGDRVILKNRYAVDFVAGEEIIHEIDTQKILNTSGGLELSVVENSLPEWLVFKDGNEDDEDEHVSGTYKLIGTPIGLENVKTYQVEINVKDGEETNKLTINVKVGLYNDNLLENVDLDNLKRDYERELL